MQAAVQHVGTSKCCGPVL